MNHWMAIFMIEFIVWLSKEDILMLILWQLICTWNCRISLMKLWVDQPCGTGAESQLILQVWKKQLFSCEANEEWRNQAAEWWTIWNQANLYFVFLFCNKASAWSLSWPVLACSLLLIHCHMYAFLSMSVMKFSRLNPKKLLKLVLQVNVR